MMVDLWNWDIRFEENLGDDWYFEAVFGAKSTLDSCSEELAEYFLEQVDENKMDYSQYKNPDFFSQFVKEEARKFNIAWRANILKKIHFWKGK